MWLCARCGNNKPSPLSECVVCASAELGLPTSAAPPARCPACKAEVAGPSALGRLRCPACKREFPDYASWLDQCRAAAYAAHPAAHAGRGFVPGPPPEGLRGVAISLLVAAPVQAVGGFIVPGLLLPCLAQAVLLALAGVFLLQGIRRADRWARLAAGLATLLPVLVLPAAYYVWVFHYFTRPAAVGHFGPAPDPAPPAARRGAAVALASLAVAAVASYASFVLPALKAGAAWNDPLPPALELGHAVVHTLGGGLLWAPVGALAGLAVLSLLGGLRRRSFAWAAGLAAALLVLLGLVPGAAALNYLDDVRRAERVALDVDVTRLLWALKEPDPKMRTAAARRLEARGREARSAAAALEQALGDVDVRVRRAAASALSLLRPDSDRAAAILADAMNDPEEAAGALRALTLFGPRARPALPALLDSLSRDAAAAPLLVEIGAGAVPGLVEALGRGNAETKARILDVLRRIGPAARSAAPAVELLLKDVDAPLRAAALRALGEIQREKAVPTLLGLLNAESPVREAAAEALCALGEREGLAGGPAPSSALNALRRPAQWDHLRRTSIDQDMDGTAGEILEELAVQALLCAEPSPGTEARLREPQRFYGSVRKRSALEVLQALDLPFVLEEDRVRILTPAQARDFWTTWIFEARAGRP